MSRNYSSSNFWNVPFGGQNEGASSSSMPSSSSDKLESFFSKIGVKGNEDNKAFPFVLLAKDKIKATHNFNPSNGKNLLNEWNDEKNSFDLPEESYPADLPALIPCEPTIDDRTNSALKMIYDINNSVRSFSPMKKEESDTDTKEASPSTGSRIETLPTMCIDPQEYQKYQETEDVQETEDLKRFYITPRDQEMLDTYARTGALIFDETSNTSKLQMFSQNPVSLDKNGRLTTDTSLTGDAFNQIYKGIKLIKLTNRDCLHNGLQYHEGEIVDNNEFKYDSSCGPDGIYFCTVGTIDEWLDYSTDPMFYMWDVTIPNNAKTMIYRNKLKSDRVILSNKRKISDHMVTKLIEIIENSDDIMPGLTYLGNLPLRFIDNGKMDEPCLMLLMKSLDAYDRLPLSCRTRAICRYMAEHDDNAYDKIKTITRSNDLLEICVKRNPLVYFKLMESDRTQSMANMVLSYDISKYECISEKHKNIENTLKYLTESKTVNAEHIPVSFINHVDVREKAIKSNGLLLEFIEYRHKTKEMCMNALAQNPLALKHVPLSMRTYEICKYAVMNIGNLNGRKYKMGFLVPYYNVNILNMIPENIKTENFMNEMISIYPNIFQMMGLNNVTMSNIFTFTETIGIDSYDPTLESDLLKIRYIWAALATTANIKLIEENLYSLLDRHPNLGFIPAQHCHVKFNKHLTDLQCYNLVMAHPKLLKKEFLRTHESKVYAVKQGLHFNECKVDMFSITSEKIEEFIRARPSVIREIPTVFLDDNMFIMCVREYGMKLSDIPVQYHTKELVSQAIIYSPDDFSMDSSNIIDQESDVKRNFTPNEEFRFNSGDFTA